MTARTVSRYVSGWCGIERHSGCRGEYSGAVCSCACHVDLGQLLAAAADAYLREIAGTTSTTAAAERRRRDLAAALRAYQQTGESE